MSADTAPAPIPVAWLRPFPPDYQIPVWRWIILPASAIMLRRNKGVWVSGSLELDENSLRFAQSKGVLPSRNQPVAWSVPLSDISSVGTSKGIASETLEIHYTGGAIKIMTVRAQDFIAGLQAAIGK